MTRATAIEVQCKRCGSSMSFDPCAHCLDGFDGHECGEDTCSCANPVDNRACGVCGGEGGAHICLSSAEYCEANPRTGQEATSRHTPEWFCCHGVLGDVDCPRCEQGDFT